MSLEKSLQNQKKTESERIIENSQKYLMPTYSRIPIVIERGAGSVVWDKEGRSYLDFVSGIGVMALGYSHPEICEVIEKASRRLVHCSNLYHIEEQTELARRLTEISFADKAFFCNSGAEANEAAIKLARKFGQKKGAYEIIAMENSFHGRTLATVGLTGQEKYRKWFGPYSPGFKFVKFNRLDELEENITQKTCAVIMEPVQGEGGIVEAEPDFLKGTRELCNEKGVLLVFDEVQCGLGRTGRWFAYEHFEVEPDIMTLAKPLAAGLPVGVCLAKKEVADIFSPGDHASTFGGGPLVCSVALKVLEIMERERLVENAEKMGIYFKNRLLSLKEKYPFVKQVRGRGLMIGVELDFEGKKILELARKKGLLINVTQKNTLRFLPPLIVTQKEIDRAVSILDEIFREVKT